MAIIVSNSHSNLPNPNQKHAAHQVFDRLYQMAALFHSNEDEQKMRSILYRLWGGVLARELNSVAGIMNPYDGKQHFSRISAEHCAKSHVFCRYLLQSVGGKMHELLRQLTNWNQSVDHMLTKSRDSQERIQAWLDQNELVKTIRHKVNLQTVSPPAKAENTTAPDALVSDIHDAPVYTASSSSSSTQTETKNTGFDYYIEGCFAHICDQTEQAIVNLKKAIEKGHKDESIGEILCSIGEKYHNAKEYDKALEVYQLGADNHYAKAQFQLGMRYINGFGVDKDFISKGFSYLLSAEQGSVNAQAMLGLYYLRGFEPHLKADKAQALKRLVIALEYKTPLTQAIMDTLLIVPRLVASAYITGTYGIEQNLPKAIIYLEHPARKGDKEAIALLPGLYYTIANAYVSGSYGLEQNIPQAMKFMEKALEIANPQTNPTSHEIKRQYSLLRAASLHPSGQYPAGAFYTTAARKRDVDVLLKQLEGIITKAGSMTVEKVRHKLFAGAQEKLEECKKQQLTAAQEQKIRELAQAIQLAQTPAVTADKEASATVQFRS